MTISKEEELFLQAAERANEMRKLNKQQQTEQTIFTPPTKQEKAIADDIEAAKIGITPQICEYCGTTQKITDHQYLHHRRYGFPIPGFICNCEKAIEDRAKKQQAAESEEKRIKLERFKNDVIESFPKRYKNCTVENFNATTVITQSHINQLIAASKTNNSILLTGTTGTGKTHLAVGFMKKVLANNFIQGRNISYGFIELYNLLNIFFEDKEKYYAIISLDLLTIDDIGTECIKEFGESKVYEIINERYKNDLQTIFTTNLSYKEMSKKLGDRVASRIRGMEELKIEFSGDDKRLVKGVNT